MFELAPPTTTVWPTAVWALVGAPTVGLVGLIMGLTWLVALIRHDAGVVHPLWPVGLVLLTWTAYAHTQGLGDESRRVLVFSLVTAWGLRLGVQRTIRHACEGGDRPKTPERTRAGAAFAWRSLVSVVALNGLLMLAVISPVLAVMSAAPPTPPHALDYIGLGVAAVGVLVEALADRRLAAVKARPETQGHVIDAGLGRLSRHPEALGECLFWLGLGLVGVGVGAAWTLLSPAVLVLLRLRRAGVAPQPRAAATIA